MGLMVDTGVFVRLERIGSVESLARIAQGAPMSISAITVSELLVGAHLADSMSRRAARFANVDATLQIMPVLDFTPVTARIHAELHAGLRRRGLIIGPHDLIIAATALEHGHDVLTGNVREFERIDGLNVIAFPAAAA